MNLALPVGRPGKVLAAGLALFALVAVWAAVVGPLLDWHAERAEALARQQTLALRMANLVRTLPELRQQAEAAVTDGPSPDAVLKGATDAVAGAALQQVVQEMAARAGASLSSTEALAAEQTGEYRRIGLRIALSAPWPVLVRLLQAVERATPMMLVDDLQLRGLRLQVAAGDPALDASMVVVAFRAGTTLPVAGQ